MPVPIERGIRRLPNGSYEVRVHVSKDPVSGKVRQLSRTTRGSEAAARKLRAKLITEVAEGKHGGTSTMFGALLDSWLEHREKMGASPTTLGADREKIERVIRPALGSVRLDKLTARHLDSLYASHRGRCVTTTASSTRRSSRPSGGARWMRTWPSAPGQAQSPRSRSSRRASTSFESCSPKLVLRAGEISSRSSSGRR